MITELEATKKAAFAAGEVLMAYYNKKIKVNYKADNAPVTEADLAAEKIIFEKLAKFNYGFLSEESNEENDRHNKESVWVIDPLDGTKGFIEKLGEFSVMIGLVKKGLTVLGVVYNPVNKNMYFAAKGEGAFKQSKNGAARRIKANKIVKTESLKIMVSRHHLQKLEIELASNLGIKERVFHTGSGLKICAIAEGKADLNINSSDKTWEWDVCAAEIILCEAGGRLSDMKGSQFLFNKRNARNLFGYVASNGAIHQKIITEISKITN